jgi:hypothetical integral membrane protein (TIGR02206 family)
MKLADFYTDTEGFSNFGVDHLVTMGLAVGFGAFLIHYARTQNQARQDWIGLILGWSLFTTVVLWTAVRIYLGVFSFRTDLPLELCYFSSLAMPWFMASRNKTAYQFLYYWILAGTTQAIVTPNIHFSFPHYTFLKYFITHCGLVICVLYVTFVYKLRPTWKGIWIAYFGWQLFFVVIGGINILLKSNYLYICNKPDTVSLVDVLGEWPRYLISAQFVSLFIFVLLWLPFRRVGGDMK